MKKLSKNAIIGYPAGIITGITYGLNPLFAMPLINKGAAIESILFFRYSLAVVLLGLFLLVTKQSFKISLKQAGVLLALGLLFTSSSIFLFESYNYIASGLATTLIFLYPALVYAIFIVIINRSKAIAQISYSLLTFYALTVGAIIFLGKLVLSGNPVTAGITTGGDWLNILGLAILPTIVSTATLAIATRNIGATKASVLGVFEPITAILVGTLVFNEPLTTNIVIGITIAIIAVTVMIYLTKR